MTLIDRLLGRGPVPPTPGTHPSGAGARDAARRELVALAVRDTLRKHGIPADWITSEAGPALTARRERGIQLRLVLRHWHPALPTCVVALQKSVVARLASLDPLCSDWLVGVAWKFEPADDSLCPTLPHPGYWQPQAAEAGTAGAVDARRALKRLFGRGDESFAGRSSADAFSPTQPMLLPGGPA
jgi:hypothetical protein